MRSGIIAEKVGMTRVFTDEGVHIPVTVLKVDNCEVIGQRTKEKDGYVALQVGAGTAKSKMETLSAAGVKVANKPSEIVDYIKEARGE